MEVDIQKILEPLSKHVPNVILALVVFIVGWLICKVVSKCMKALLHKAKVDERLNKKKL